MSERLTFLHESDIFKGIENIDAVDSFVSTMQTKEDQIVSESGEVGAGLVLIQKGSFKLEWPSIKGIRNDVNMSVEVGYFWGELSLFAPDKKRQIKATSEGEGELIKMSPQQYSDLESQYPLAAYKLAYNILKRAAPAIYLINRNLTRSG